MTVETYSILAIYCLLAGAKDEKLVKDFSVDVPDAEKLVGLSSEKFASEISEWIFNSRDGGMEMDYNIFSHVRVCGRITTMYFSELKLTAIKNIFEIVKGFRKEVIPENKFQEEMISFTPALESLILSSWVKGKILEELEDYPEYTNLIFDFLAKRKYPLTIENWNRMMHDGLRFAEFTRGLYEEEKK